MMFNKNGNEIAYIFPLLTSSSYVLYLNEPQLKNIIIWMIKC